MLGYEWTAGTPGEKYRIEKEVEMNNEKLAILDGMVAEAASWGLYQILKRKGFPVRTTDGVRDVKWTPSSCSNQMLFRVPVMVGRLDEVSDEFFYVEGVINPSGIIVTDAYDAEGKDIYFSPFKPRL